MTAPREFPPAAPAPVLGERCLPGCGDPRLDGDGAHMCTVRLGTVPLRDDLPPSEASAVAVEVDQVQQPDGSLTRELRLLPLDHRGHYHGDGFIVTAPTVEALTALLRTGLAVAGVQPAPGLYGSTSQVTGPRRV